MDDAACRIDLVAAVRQIQAENRALRGRISELKADVRDKGVLLVKYRAHICELWAELAAADRLQPSRGSNAGCDGPSDAREIPHE